jgi:ribonucleoside-diphosphate reductase beta chain
MTNADSSERAAPRSGGLRHDSVPMRLYHEAKDRGAWDPRQLGLREDARDWSRLSVTERDVLLRLTGLFKVAEESMTRDLLPFLMIVLRENRPEEELFLTTFLSDEAKHTEFFQLVLDDIYGHSGDLLRYQTASFRKFFAEKLPTAMKALLADASPVAQAEALVTYTLVGEGVLGEAGYHVFTTALEGAGLMPRFREGLRLAQADEERHMAYGAFVLSRLVAQDPEVWAVISARLDQLVPDTLGVVTEFFQPYDAMPFGLSLEATIEYTMARFADRWTELEKARERGRGRPVTSGREEAVRLVLAWVRERAVPAPVEVHREGADPVYTFRVGAEEASALLITQEVLDGHAPGDIVAALASHRVPERLRERPHQRVICLQVGDQIVVQGPPG